MSLASDMEKRRGYAAPNGWLALETQQHLNGDASVPMEERIMMAAIAQLEQGRPRLREVLLNYVDFQFLVLRLNARVEVINPGEDNEQAELCIATAAGMVRVRADKDCPRDVIYPGPHARWVLWEERTLLSKAQLQERAELERIELERWMDAHDLTQKALEMYHEENRKRDADRGKPRW